jgi:hypothetical protein
MILMEEYEKRKDVLRAKFSSALDIYDDFELIDKYRFDRQSIMMICDMLQDDLESSTFRNRAYFFFAIILMWNIFLFFLINWTLCIGDNLPERVQILGHAHILCITIRCLSFLHEVMIGNHRNKTTES